MRKKELSYDEAQPRALPCAIVDIVSYREGVEKTRGFGTLNIRSRGDKKSRVGSFLSAVEVFLHEFLHEFGVGIGFRV